MPEIVRCPNCGLETYRGLAECPHCNGEMPPHLSLGAKPLDDVEGLKLSRLKVIIILIAIGFLLKLLVTYIFK